MIKVYFRNKKHTSFNSTKKAAGLEKGSGVPHIEKVGKVNREQLENIVKTKDGDLTAGDLDAAVRTIAGTARSMGIEVEGFNVGQTIEKNKKISKLLALVQKSYGPERCPY